MGEIHEQQREKHWKHYSFTLHSGFSSFKKGTWKSVFQTLPSHWWYITFIGCFSSFFFLDFSLQFLTDGEGLKLWSPDKNPDLSSIISLFKLTNLFRSDKHNLKLSYKKIYILMSWEKTPISWNRDVYKNQLFLFKGIFLVDHLIRWVFLSTFVFPKILIWEIKHVTRRTEQME